MKELKGKRLEDYFRELVSMDVQDKDGDMWFAASNRNGIYRVNTENYEIVEKHRFEGEENSEFMLYHDMEIYGNRIFFAPHKAEKIAVYDVDSHEETYISLKPIEGKYRNSYLPTQKFASTFQDERYVYMLGYTYPAIIKMDAETLEITYIDGWLEEIEKYTPKHISYGYFTMGNVKRGRKVLLPMGCICGLLELDLDTGETKVICPAISMEGIGGIADDDNGNIWIVGRGIKPNIVARWNIQEDKYKETEIPIDEGNCQVPFYEPLCYEGRVFLFPVYTNCAYEISVVDGQFKISRILESCVKERNRYSHLQMCTFSPRIIDGKIRFATGQDGLWHIYHLESSQIDDFYIVDDENAEACVWESMRRIFGQSPNSVTAEGFYQLENFVDYVISEKNERFVTNEEKVGKNIYYAAGGFR